MNGSRSGNGYQSGSGGEMAVATPDSGTVFGGLWVILFVGTFLVAGPWAGFHAVLFGCVGILMLLRPPAFILSRWWWILAALFIILGSAAFLPAAWFGIPEWRVKLESLGVHTGSLVAIQARQAAEAFALFAITLFIGLWLAGHRPSASQLRVWALAFTVGVAIYAIVSKLRQDPVTGLYGFFPNRNHTATYLAMGTICGLGNVLQALRDRRFLAMSIALIATAICIWAVAGWSVSRGGVVLVAIGCLAWLPMLGTRYLGKNGLRALGLMGLAGLGLFFIADSGVKDRISKTVEKAGNSIGPASDPAAGGGNPAVESSSDLDFRIPIALDTLDLIRAFKWTGIGAGQYYYIFPQYQKRTAVANESDCYHPESDWLWMAAEAGVPATCALLALVAVAFRKSLFSIRTGSDRALRAACLVAAMLVPIHGVFDVPGHRITLALSAAFLFSLSLRLPSTSVPPPWGGAHFRIAGILQLMIAGLLGWSQWGAGPKPALTVAQDAIRESERLVKKDRILQEAVAARGESYQPAPADDLLEKSLGILDRARQTAPLNRDLIRNQAFIALNFDDKYDLVDHLFALDRALDPAWVEGPIRQAMAWAQIDQERSAALWREALARSERADRQRGQEVFRAQTLGRMREAIRKNPDLAPRLPAIDLK